MTEIVIEIVKEIVIQTMRSDPLYDQIDSAIRSTRSVHVYAQVNSSIYIYTHIYMVAPL